MRSRETGPHVVGCLIALDLLVPGHRHLHATAFIADQHHRLQDALVDMLPSVMRSFGSAVTRDHREAVFAQRKSEAGRLEGMLDIVDAEVLDPLRGIRAPVEDGTMSDALKLEGPIGRFLRKTTLRKNIVRTSQVPGALAGLMCSGRAIMRSAAPECQSKSPDRMMCSHPSGDVNGSRAGSYKGLVLAGWLAALSM